MTALLLIALFIVPTPLLSQNRQPDSSAEELLEQAIRYADPQDVWQRSRMEFQVETKIEAEMAKQIGFSEFAQSITIDNANGTYRTVQKIAPNEIDMTFDGENFKVLINNSAEFTPEESKKLTGNADPKAGAAFRRNYDAYLYGLPMKLRDDGTVLDPQAKRLEFQGRDAHEIKVTYREDVGGHVWYFYLSVKDGALLGARFHGKGSPGEGETIVLKGEHQGSNGIRMAERRLWYLTSSHELIGTDVIVAFQAETVR